MSVFLRASKSSLMSSNAAGILWREKATRIVQTTTRRVQFSSSTTKTAEKKVVSEAAASTEGGLLAFPKNHPFLFQLMVATGKTSAADVVCQVVAEKKKFSEIDWKRNGIFVIFGFAYLGGFQYWLMVNKYRQWFPTMDRFAKLPFAQKLKDSAGMLDAGKMVLFDILVHLPFIYFPTYYTIKESVFGKSWNPVDWAVDGVTKWKGNFSEDWAATIKVWGPSDCVQFVLPLWMRMPFRHGVSFFWTAYVSFSRGAKVPDEETEAVQVIKAES
eukprot:CAMPEP_0178978212 /NCGR_PEP_ID=MMETSP0789-20121207/25008_1 /TAXON_ID=3005 /ORGANISM="Rhizosolenia setigera, Strain CCMP 1694" /LENGTH=271 /DNA_ID=CAMNT_0020667875 /DNA_START=39 /DNA_END=854 /DNA_ORIENTATION=-